jgi:hypothetical protein
LRLIQAWTQAQDLINIDIMKDHELDDIYIDQRFDELTQQEITWSCQIYWNLLDRGTCHQDQPIAGFESALKRSEATLHAEISSILEHELKQRLRLDLDHVDAKGTSGRSVTPTVIALIFTLSVGIMMTWCMSWIMSSILGVFLGNLLGVLIGLVIGMLSFDLISLVIILRIHNKQGVTIRELERQRMTRDKYRLHQEAWGELTQHLKSYLMSPQVQWIHPLDLLERRLEDLARLTGGPR